MSDLEAVTEAAQTHIAGFRPQSRGEVEAFFTGLPAMLRELGMSLDAAAANLDDEFIHPAVLDTLRELAHVVAGTADTAEEAFSVHAREHSLWRND